MTGWQNWAIKNRPCWMKRLSCATFQHILPRKPLNKLPTLHNITQKEINKHNKTTSSNIEYMS